MRFFDWFKRRKRKQGPKYFGQVRFVERITEIPDEIGTDIYIVRREKHDIWAAFMCPCQTGHRLTVNLSTNRKPYWRARVKAGNFSLSPSIWLNDDCFSHFWIQDHRVWWVAED